MPAYSITSATEKVHKSGDYVYNFLSDFNNFHHLLPADKITGWSCSGTTCSFSVAGIIEVKLHIADRVPLSRIKYISDPGSKYPFHFIVYIEKIDENSCFCTITMEYELNALLNGMAEKTLRNIVNGMAGKIKEV